MKFKCSLLVAIGLTVAAVATGTLPARAADVVADWNSIKTPPAPQLKAVTVDPKTTALLMLDFMNQNCGKRPACVATIPAMKKLLAAARAAKVMVVFNGFAKATTADVLKDVSPTADEPFIRSGPNKFVNTDLDKMLKDKGIKTVITVGTASNGAVLFTAADAAFHGLKVIVPVDGMSAADPFADLTTAFTFINAPTVSAASTLTRSDMIKF